jgi:hypothetical protein
MTYKGATYHASIEGDNFVYEGRSISPSEFANTVAGGTARNAWRDLWIKRPSDHDFRMADDLRREIRARIKVTPEMIREGLQMTPEDVKKILGL